MERVCFYERLFAGTESEHDRRIATLPTALIEAVHGAGIRQLSAFRRGTDLWTYGECEPDAVTALGRLRTDAAYRDWSRDLRSVIAEAVGPDRAQIVYREIFHTGGRATEPHERGVFALVVDPDRVTEYDDRHATVWPDMLEALAASGFRNYSGFRRGSQVVYYGEFEPDMTTAMARMSETDVNRRWGESFSGIITTLTDESGQVFRAREVFHLDEPPLR
jgi:L-rhamnose mutarotase